MNRFNRLKKVFEGRKSALDNLRGREVTSLEYATAVTKYLRARKAFRAIRGWGPKATHPALRYKLNPQTLP